MSKPNSLLNSIFLHERESFILVRKSPRPSKLILACLLQVIKKEILNFKLEWYKVLSGIMKLFVSLLVFVSISFFFIKAEGVSGEQSIISAQIYSRHWEDLPVYKTRPETKNILLIHDLFVLSFNPDRRLPDWMAYELSPSVVWGALQEDRKWKPDPLLPSFLSLTAQNYKGASGWGYDRGHLAPKGSFKGSVFAYQAQYVTNLVPQKRNLNQGPWRVLEEAVRRFVLKGYSVKILTGPLYGHKTLPVWPSAQGRLRQIPSGYWKIVSLKEKGILNVCPFIMPQEISSRRTALKKYKTKEVEIEKHSQLLLFENYKGRVRENCKFLL